MTLQTIANSADSMLAHFRAVKFNQTASLADFIAQSKPLLIIAAALFELANESAFTQPIHSQELAQLNLAAQQLTALSEQLPPQLDSEFVALFQHTVAKLAQFVQHLQAVEYKRQADLVLLSRGYEGTQSVGYTFNPDHSLQDFIHAVRG